jgi:hypothetical protein
VLNSGQSPADVAKANNVDVQVVIATDQVKDGEQELADQVPMSRTGSRTTSIEPCATGR